MTLPAVIALGLILLGVAASAYGLIVLGILAGATSWLSNLWSRRGLDGVRYERNLANDRAVWGDSIELTVTIENRKLLPLAWLQADDFGSGDIVVRERPLIPSERPGYGILQNVWSLAPFERVRRRFHLEADHRGLFSFDSVRLSVADVFGQDVAAAEEPRRATFLVRPRTVPIRAARGALVPFGTRRARRGLIEDPSLFAGIRPFQRGDPRRRVHERASARLGAPVSKRYEPSTAREVVVAVDLQTQPGPAWILSYDEDLVESLAVAAASLARRFLSDGAACGVAANGYTYTLARTGFVPARAGREQLARIADLLGRTSSTASVPFERLLADLPTRLASGTLIVTVSGREVGPYASALLRLRSVGFEVRHVAMGPNARSHAATARQLGIDASVGRLEPDWRTSDALTLAS
jgi:uncharacterized protein (DUF58 family)